MTAATGDKRVAAIVPMVIDNLNTTKQMEYQLETWGVYSESIKDYTERNIIRLDNTPQSEFEKSLWTMIDPYSYLPRLTMPKLLIHGANDPYWTVDAAQWYFDDLPGAKYILTVPNAGHDLGLASGEQAQVMRAALRIAMSAAVFAKHAAQGGNWPTMEWKLAESDTGYQIDINTNLPLRVTEGKSSGVKLWTAQSETKDFRKATWASVDQKGSLSISVPKPKSGHIAFFVEIESNNTDDPPRIFSVTTRVWRF
jgi:PhoPQ-activated pathogenicity-related protein